MQVATVRPTGRDHKFAYEIEIVSSGFGLSKWVLIPEDVASITITISFENGGRAKIQTTTDLLQKVKNGENLTPVDWTLGVVNNTIQDSVVPVTAIRLMQTSITGNSKMTLRAQ